MALIDGLVSMALLGLALGIFASYGSTLFATRSATDLLKQKILIKNMLLNAVSCENIAACKGSEFRDLLDIGGTLLVKKDGSSTYGPWQVRAQCQADQTLEVRVSSTLNGQVRPDPLTKKPLSWSHNSAVLIQAGVLCGQIKGNKSSTGIFPITSARCTVNQGTCAPPELSKGVLGAPDRMCCENGKDVPKPSCPALSKEVGAYWDREEDWGVEGKWVVLCQ